MIRKINNMKLNRKIMLIVLIFGILPVFLASAYSLQAIKHEAGERQIYALNQGYNQVRQSVEDCFLRVHNISTLLAINDTLNLTLKLNESDKSVLEELSMFEDISAYAYSMELSFSENNIVFYIDDSFMVANSENGRYRKRELAEKSAWYQKLEENNGRPTWIYFGEDADTNRGEALALTRELWDKDDFSHSVGVLAVLLNQDYIKKMLMDSNEEQIIYLEDIDGTLLASNCSAGELIRVPLEQRGINDDAFHDIEIEGKQYLVRSEQLDDTNVCLISLVNQYSISNFATRTMAIMNALYFLAGVSVLLIMYFLIQTITKRIHAVGEKMNRVQHGALEKVEELTPVQDEIGQLVVNYNYMITQIDELLHEQYVLGQEKNSAELKALQSQINPHFLYNTLDMISWMAQKGETDNIRSVIQAMSHFYRLTLSKGKNIVTIRDEIKLCEAYMEIQKRRFRGKIRFEVDVQEEILDFLIPKITLQPFLENAIIHGINEKEDGRGVVSLNGWTEDGEITLSVTDDGNGMRESDKENATGGSHYGMANIEKRLSLFYEKEITVQIESSLGIGTCVIIVIPEVSEPGEGKQDENSEV